MPVAEDGGFTLYLEAASNPLLLGVPPFIEDRTGRPCHQQTRTSQYVFKSADLAEFDERYENYSVDLDVVELPDGIRRQTVARATGNSLKHCSVR